MPKYLNRVCITFSIMINVLFGGSMNQTLSATQYQRKRDGKVNLVWIIDTIFFLEAGHCQNAWIKWQIIFRAIYRYDIVGEVLKEKDENTKSE